MKDRQKYIDYVTIEDVLSAKPAFDILQLKYDGIWVRLVVDDIAHNFTKPQGSVFLGSWFSRTGELKHQRHVKLLPGVYTGEYMFGSQWAQDPNRLGTTFLFDCVRTGDEIIATLPYFQRHGILKSRLQSARDGKLVLVDNVDISLATTCWERVLANKYEGLIFRRSQDDYCSSLGRLKRKVTREYVILDVIEGNNRLTGSLGALRLGLFTTSGLVEITKCGGGFSDLQRSDIWSAWPRDKGRVITVEGRTVFASGAIRHPEFIGFRDDVRPEECRLEVNAPDA